MPTFSAAVAETYRALSKFRADALPLVDGDRGDYVAAFEKLAVRPRAVVQLGAGASIECLSAWLLHPAAEAGLLSKIGRGTQRETLDSLRAIKDSFLSHEELVWEASACAETLQRLQSFLGDLCRIAQGVTPQHQGWTEHARATGLRLYTATHIAKL